MPVQARTESGPGLVRWILVLTLGCSLGLLLVYVAVSRRYFSPPPPHGLQIIRGPVPSPGTHYSVSDEAVEKELRAVIESQLSAFRKDDYPEAYGFAASSMRSQIPLPAFEQMVKTMFPVIARSDSAHFGMMLDDGQLALVIVTVAGPAGRSHHYEYAMQRERYGWKIAGVREVQINGVTL